MYVQSNNITPAKYSTTNFLVHRLIDFQKTQLPIEKLHGYSFLLLLNISLIFVGMSEHGAICTNSDSSHGFNIYKYASFL